VTLSDAQRATLMARVALAQENRTHWFERAVSSKRCIREEKKMRLLTRSLVAAILTAGCYLSIPTVNVLAQSPPPGPSISARDLSDQKLNAVATALERVASLRNDYRQRIAEVEAPAEKERIVAEANKELSKAVTEGGLSVDEYTSILDAARDNPEVRDKLFQHVRPSDK
jgi:hypothetical protein